MSWSPLLGKHGLTFVQYFALSWLRDGIALNPKDICFQFRHNGGALQSAVEPEMAAAGVDAYASHAHQAVGEPLCLRGGHLAAERNSSSAAAGE
jgi:hypothetical protein